MLHAPADVPSAQLWQLLSAAEQGAASALQAFDSLLEPASRRSPIIAVYQGIG